jgi:hypothetical protein
MSRPQKIHPPLPFSFNQVLSAVAAGKGIKPVQKASVKTVSESNKKQRAKKSK